MHTLNLVSAPLFYQALFRKCTYIFRLLYCNLTLANHKIVSLPSLIHPAVSRSLHFVLCSREYSVSDLCFLKMLEVIAVNLEYNQRFPNISKKLINKQQRNMKHSFNTKKIDGWLSWFLPPICVHTRLTNNSKKAPKGRFYIFKSQSSQAWG